MSSLSQFGWTKQHQMEWDLLSAGEFQPARIIADFGTSVKIATPDIMTAELSGKLAHYTDREAMPKVGDWVAVRVLDSGAVVESVVLRANEIARKVTGKRTVKQIFAANVDIAFVLLALDSDFSVERLKRFLFQLSVSEVEPVIVLNKADKTNDLQSYIDQLEIFDVPVVSISATDDSAANEVLSKILPGKTAILLGSSGVGKSTLTNKLLGRQAQQTEAISTSNASGKHTTVHRELFLLPNGGILIDTPGIRELQLWGTEEEIANNFDDITALASKCKYTSCTHNHEKGCAVHKALANGTLDKNHYANYLKMKTEVTRLKTRNVEKDRLANGRDRREVSTKNYGYSDE